MYFPYQYFVFYFNTFDDQVFVTCNKTLLMYLCPCLSADYPKETKAALMWYLKTLQVKTSAGRQRGKNVASVSDVIIKGDKSSEGNMWKIKGCRGGVGVVLEDVLVAWSVGPVPTKHLISLIKRTLAWCVLNSGGLGPRAKSALTSSLPHTSRRCHQPQQHEE